MDKFQNLYRIPSARATWHSYDGGIFFITICTKNKVHYFGEIVNGCRDAARHVSTGMDIEIEPQMQLSPLGKCVADNLQNVAEHYPYAYVPLFVVMPNHIHAIVVIDGEKTQNKRRNHVETCRAASLQQSEKMADIANMQGWLSVVVGGFKSAITRFAHTNGIDFAWQARFYDRIVRNQDELNRIAQYIDNNVANWQYDELHPNK